MEICRSIYRFSSTGSKLFLNDSEEEWMMKQWLVGGALVLGLTGCASQAIENMNAGLSLAMGKNVSHLTEALGQPIETTDQGSRTRYRWFKESHIEPCNVEVWADSDGIVRKTSWTGYRGACESFAEGLSRVYPLK
jgi:hypothetical protein